MATMINLNGRVTDLEHALVSVFDHGFLYGEGIYETLRTYHGEPFLFDRHMRRLHDSARMMALSVPIDDATLKARAVETMRAAALGQHGQEAYIRILITRGVGELSYDIAACPSPTIIVIVKPHADPPPSVYHTGVAVAIVDTVRNHPASVNPLIKSNNLLNNALGMQEATRRGAFEGVMRNYRGEIAECTTANIFIVKNGRTLTPPIHAGLLAGLTREFVLELCADAGLPAAEATLDDHALLHADEAFLTSTTREIVPITSVDAHPVADGRPGPITQQLLARYRRTALALTAPSARA
jgi:branched-chain amino acid aminotransferase